MSEQLLQALSGAGMELFGLPHPRDILSSAYEAFVFYFLHFAL